jgi:hypothetical protein
MAVWLDGIAYPSMYHPHFEHCTYEVDLPEILEDFKGNAHCKSTEPIHTSQTITL